MFNVATHKTSCSDKVRLHSNSKRPEVSSEGAIFTALVLRCPSETLTKTEQNKKYCPIIHISSKQPGMNWSV